MQRPVRMAALQWHSMSLRPLSNAQTQKFDLGGHSEGAMIVHNAANALSLSVGQVTAAILFGDPFKMVDVGKLDKQCQGVLRPRRSCLR